MSRGFSLVVAADAQNGIGNAGGLPWRIPRDMVYFRKLTSEAPDGLHNAVLMGRKTYDSIPDKFRPLSGRLNIVLSHGQVDAPDSVLVAQSFDAALALADDREAPRIFVIGGAQIYALALAHPRCETVYLTRVHHTFECDAFLPPLRRTFACARRASCSARAATRSRSRPSYAARSNALFSLAPHTRARLFLARAARGRASTLEDRPMGLMNALVGGGTGLIRGETAPDVTLPDQDGNEVSLSSFRGKKNVVVYFYPKDDTPGCTRESCAFRDHYTAFTDVGAEVIGISNDSVSSHKAFATKHRLPFTLLSDSRGDARRGFKVPASFGLLPGRVTFVLDKQGVVQHAFNSQLNFTQHVDEALDVLKKLA